MDFGLSVRVVCYYSLKVPLRLFWKTAVLPVSWLTSLIFHASVGRKYAPRTKTQLNELAQQKYNNFDACQRHVMQHNATRVHLSATDNSILQNSAFFYFILK